MAEERNIDAYPTKEFFIDMLTRDIRLSRAIIDLIDNSIDGAKNIRPNENYEGLKVEITASKDKFVIKDNCGGFPLKVAKKYAFRFGRPNVEDEEAKFAKHSIGRFGVGMKRALFKLGAYFTVESKHKDDHFLVEQDVEEWLDEPDNWKFNYQKNDEIPAKKAKLNDEDGTVITVTKLHENVRNDFDDDSFLNDLNNEISLAESYSLLKKLSLTLNNKEIERKDIGMLEGEELKPLFKKVNNNGVSIRVYAGIGEPSPTSAGWYIFCNDRLVLEADKSYLTGWKEDRGDSENIIKYHNQYAMFRGVVFFDADDSSKLPMTTTKTGIDSDHPIYKSTRPEILVALKKVTNFLKKIDNKEERDEIVNNATRIDITEIQSNEDNYTSEFLYPEIEETIQNSLYTTISYAQKRDLVERLQDYLGVSTNKEVGEKTFEYFLEMKEIN